jgi:hypothetical protein
MPEGDRTLSREDAGNRRVGRAGIEAYRFWRELARPSSITVLPAGQATELLENHELFADLDERSARIVVDQVIFGPIADRMYRSRSSVASFVRRRHSSSSPASNLPSLYIERRRRLRAQGGL